MSFVNLFNPFVGLRPFSSDESLLFFGRQQQTLELLQRLHQHHFVAVVGSSGSGKSSLIRAGLIPALKAGYLVNDRDRWMISIMKPGQSPVYNLADAIINQPKSEIDTSSVKGLVKKIKEEGTDAILDTLKPLWENNNTNFFLLIDQFEELFRFSMEQKEVAKKDEAVDFVNIMLELSRQTDLPIYVVITMRSDFIGDCARFYGLPEAMNQSQYLVPRLNRIQLKNAIEGPVKLSGGIINSTLTSKLLNDVGSVRDELPLLQHALMRIWDHETNVDKNGELDLKDYEMIGGMEKALSNHADEALMGMSDEELSLTKKIFQALTAIDENGRKIRRPVRLSDLKIITGANTDQLQNIINRFIEGKKSFLVVNKAEEEDDEVIDISHESLIRQWVVLNGWVDEEAESSKIYLRLVESANLYKENKKNFITGIELTLAFRWYEEFKPVPVWAKRYHKDFEESIQYLKESDLASYRSGFMQRRAKKRRALLIMFLLLVVISALIYNNFKLTRLKDEAEIQKRSALVEKASAYLSATRAEEQKRRADSSANEAINARVTAERQTQKADSSAKVARAQARLAEIARNEAEMAQKDAEIQRVISYENQQRAQTQTGLAKKALEEAEAQRIRATETGKAFRLIILAREKVKEDPTLALRITEASMNKEQDSLILREAQQIFEQNSFYKIIQNTSIRSSAVSADRTEILTGGYDRIARLWTRNGSLVREFEGNREPVMSVAFSPDGTKIATGGYDHIARLYDKKGPLLKEFKGNQGVVFSVAFSPDGKTIITGHGGGIAKLWNVDGATGTPLKEYNIKSSGYISSVAFSRDGKKVLTANDRVSYLWDTYGSQFRDLNVTARSLAIFKTGETILIGSKKDAEGFFNLEGDLLENFQSYQSKITSVTFSPNGKLMATGLEDGSARLYNESGGSFIKEFRGHTQAIVSLAFSNDGATLITWSRDGTVRSWQINKGLQNEFNIQNKNQINSFVFWKDAQKILTVSENKSVQLWNMNGSPVAELKANAAEINYMAFSPNGKMILTGYKDSTGILWNIDGTRIRQLYGSSFAFSVDSKMILAGSNDGKIKISDNSGKLLHEFQEQNKKAITCAAFSPDGKTLLTGSNDQSISLWNADGSLLWRRRVEYSTLSNTRGDGTITSVNFSPDAKKIMVGASIPHSRGNYEDGVLLDISGSLIKQFSGEGFIFSADGKQILAWSWAFCRLYNADGSLIWTYDVPDVNSATFSADGKSIITGSTNGTIRRWDTAMTLKEFLESDGIERLTEAQLVEFGIK